MLCFHGAARIFENPSKFVSPWCRYNMHRCNSSRPAANFSSRHGFVGLKYSTAAFSVTGQRSRKRPERTNANAGEDKNTKPTRAPTETSVPKLLHGIEVEKDSAERIKEAEEAAISIYKDAGFSTVKSSALVAGVKTVSEKVSEKHEKMSQFIITTGFQELSRAVDTAKHDIKAEGKATERRLKAHTNSKTQSMHRRVRADVKKQGESMEKRLKADVNQQLQTTEKRLKADVNQQLQTTEKRLKADLGEMLTRQLTAKFKEKEKQDEGKWGKLFLALKVGIVFVAFLFMFFNPNVRQLFGKTMTEEVLGLFSILGTVVTCIGLFWSLR